MIFYHVDRCNSLNSLGELSLIPVSPTPEFGFKIASHGLNHFFRNKADWSEIYELALEFVRQIKYPKYASRFECLFAHETRDKAYDWATRYIKPNVEFQIAEIETDVFYKFDCSWFTPIAGKTVIQLKSNSLTLSAACEIADNYWSGKETNTPDIEVLIPLPCRIVNITKHIVRSTVHAIIPFSE